MSPEQWITILGTVGFPAAFTIWLCWKVILPASSKLVDAHTETLRNQRETNEKMCDGQESISKTQIEIQRGLERLNERIELIDCVNYKPRHHHDRGPDDRK